MDVYKIMKFSGVEQNTTFKIYKLILYYSLFII